MQKPTRPIGVAVLTVIDIIAGIGLLVLGDLMSIPCPPETECHLTGLVNSLAPLPILLALFVMVISYGTWSGSGWGRMGNVVLTELGIALVIGVFVFSLRTLEGILTGIGILLFAILIGNILIFWYLRRPHVKAYFGKG